MAPDALYNRARYSRHLYGDGWMANLTEGGKGARAGARYFADVVLTIPPGAATPSSGDSGGISHRLVTGRSCTWTSAALKRGGSESSSVHVGTVRLVQDAQKRQANENTKLPGLTPEFLAERHSGAGRPR